MMAASCQDIDGVWVQGGWSLESLPQGLEVCAGRNAGGRRGGRVLVVGWYGFRGCSLLRGFRLQLGGFSFADAQTHVNPTLGRVASGKMNSEHLRDQG